MLLLNNAIVASMYMLHFVKSKQTNISTKNNLILGYKVSSERFNTEKKFLLMPFLVWA